MPANARDLKPLAARASRELNNEYRNSDVTVSLADSFFKEVATVDEFQARAADIHRLESGPIHQIPIHRAGELVLNTGRNIELIPRK